LVPVGAFPDADRFASYNGTAPIDVSSGSRKIYRQSVRGNRRLNHPIHMAAVTQIAHHNSDGRAYYARRLKRARHHPAAWPAAPDGTICARQLCDRDNHLPLVIGDPAAGRA
jgi:transposase